MAAILDLFSRYVVGWAVSAVNDRHLTVRALELAIKRRCPQAGLLHHSDQGATDASEAYQRSLATHGLTCSMSRRGNCYDNAVMESFFSTNKFELGEYFESCGDANMQLFDDIEVFVTSGGRVIRVPRVLRVPWSDPRDPRPVSDPRNPRPVSNPRDPRPVSKSA